MTSERQSDGDGLWRFFVLVSVLSVPFWLAGAGLHATLLPGLPVSALGAVCPVAAAAIVVFRRDGAAGVAALLARSFDISRAQRKYWFAVAIFLPPAAAFATFAVLQAMGRLPAPPILSPLLLVAMVAGFGVGALAEELGWSGFATAPLQNRWGPLPAALFLGVFWAVWHFVPLIEAQRGFGWIAWWSLGTISTRVIMVWLFDNTGGSVFAVALLHAMGNLCVFAAPGSYDPAITGSILFAIALAVVATGGMRRNTAATGASPL